MVLQLEINSFPLRNQEFSIAELIEFHCDANSLMRPLNTYIIFP